MPASCACRLLITGLFNATAQDVAAYVGKPAAACVQHFLRLPIEEPYAPSAPAAPRRAQHPPADPMLCQLALLAAAVTPTAGATDGMALPADGAAAVAAAEAASGAASSLRAAATACLESVQTAAEATAAAERTSMSDLFARVPPAAQPEHAHSHARPLVTWSTEPAISPLKTGKNMSPCQGGLSTLQPAPLSLRMPPLASRSFRRTCSTAGAHASALSMCARQVVDTSLKRMEYKMRTLDETTVLLRHERGQLERMRHQVRAAHVRRMGAERREGGCAAHSRAGCHGCACTRAACMLAASVSCAGLEQHVSVTLERVARTGCVVSPWQIFAEKLTLEKRRIQQASSMPLTGGYSAATVSGVPAPAPAEAISGAASASSAGFTR